MSKLTEILDTLQKHDRDAFYPTDASRAEAEQAILDWIDKEVIGRLYGDDGIADYDTRTMDILIEMRKRAGL